MYDATPAATIDANLSLSQDAARAKLGAPWRMPSAAEFQELFDNCSNIWTTLNGMNGRLFTSNINGETLFLPAAGYYGTSLNERGSFGDYWSSTYLSVSNARNLNFDSSSVSPERSSNRRYGFSIRAVQDGTPNRSVIPPTPEVKPKEEEETPTVEEPKDKDER